MVNYQIESEHLVDAPSTTKSTQEPWFTLSLRNALLDKEVSSPKIFDAGQFSTGNYSYSNSLVEEDEAISIVSDDSYQESERDFADEERVAETKKTLKQIYGMLPAIFKSSDPHTILAQHFLNETFFAENLANLHENFHDLMTAVRALPSTLLILRRMDIEVERMMSTVYEFNKQIRNLVQVYETKDVSLFTMKDAKDQMDALVHKYLGEDLSQLIDLIVDLMFEIDEKEGNSPADEEMQAEVTYLHDKLSKALLVKSPFFGKREVSEFKNILQESFIESPAHIEYISELLKLMKSL